jgi:lysophospholipase L1-like esterase
MSLLLIAALAASSPQPVPAALPLTVGGRVERGANGSMRFGWPGTYFEARFQGDRISVATDSKSEHLRLLVDGEEKAVLREAGPSLLTLSGLYGGEHVVRLEKMTESQTGGARLLFIHAEGRSVPLEPIRRERRIEFIGDSYTVGYGNMSPVRQCTRDQVHDLTNTQLGFGPLTAKRFDADYRIHAYSGFGIVRNYNGSSPGMSLPAIYDRALPGEPAMSADDGWRPQLIVINLGTNDFSTELQNGEKWPNQPALRSDYRQSYVGFLRKLMKTQPQARFILMGSDTFITEVEQVAASLDAAEREKIVTLKFAGLDLMGCDWHPSLTDHRALAEMIAGAIAKTGLGWAPATTPESGGVSSSSSSAPGPHPSARHARWRRSRAALH